MDYEYLILARQESESDDCANCSHKQECRDGNYTIPPCEVTEEHYFSTLF